MKKKYLKIGELAKLKGVSVKSLRYYDRIGVLPPAYINEETGYRYYAPEQLILLDIIQLCLTFQLPLRSLQGEAPSPDLKNLILGGQAQAREKIREAEKMLRLSHDILEQLNRLEHPRKERELYFQPFPARTILTEPWQDGSDDGSSYMRKIGLLHEKAREAGLAILTQQGILMELTTGTYFVFLAVEGEAEAARTLPAAEYACMILKEKDLKAIPELLREKGLEPAFALCLNTDIYD